MGDDVPIDRRSAVMGEEMASARTALVLIDLQQWIVDMQWEPVAGGVVADTCVELRDRFAHVGSPAVNLVRYVRADGADGSVDAAPTGWSPALNPAPGTVW
ncbi:hypothetical protein ACWD62_23555 [Streptomyces sp. NPDC005146]